GHPAETLVPLLWILAAADARRGHTVRAALVVGLSAGLETWGLLGVAVLALAPSVRRALAGAALAGGVGLALYLPFVAGGHFEMASYRWQVSPHSLLALAVAPGTPFGWAPRLAQGALAVGVGILVARARTPHALWLVPIAVVLARLAVDPLVSDYYFVAVEG